MADLPSGYTDALRRAVDVHTDGGQPDTLVICAGVVNSYVALTRPDGLPFDPWLRLHVHVGREYSQWHRDLKR